MLVLAAAVLSSSFALSQQAPPPAATAPTAPAAPVVRQPPGNPGMRQGMRPGMMQRPMRPGMQGNFRGNMHSGFHGNMRGEEGGMGGPGSHIAPAGMWWKNPMVVQRLTLTPEQTRKMDDIFQQSRLQLIDLKAGVQKQEVMLEPLLSANPLDTLKAQAQIDKVADARAALEKANAHMLLGIRGVLTPDQWTKLHSRGAGEPGGGQTGAPAAAPGGPGGRSRGMRPGGSGSSTNLIDPIDVP
jgi:Spy/CpxP family protein refolding chaperone